MEKKADNDRIEKFDVIIVGAGAAGLMCAASPAWEQVRPASGDGAVSRLILERGDRPGIKLLMSGGGHCNITHDGPARDLLPAYGKAGRTLRGAIIKYSNKDSEAFLKRAGVPLYSDAAGRMLPVSMKAADVLDAYLEAAGRNGFRVRYGQMVRSIEERGSDEDREYLLDAGSKTYLCKTLIIATGGCSYPKTGSDGAMFGTLKRCFGLEVTPLMPGLVPVITEDYPYGDLAGITLQHVRISIHRDGEKSVHREGAILFTHSAFSGPCALDISGYAASGSRVAIDYIHPVTFDEAYAKIREKRIRSGKEVAEAFSLPRRLAALLAERAADSPKRLAHLLTEDTFTVTGTEGFKSAMVTKGGVGLQQIVPSSMELKDRPGVYLIGEVLDADGASGGYNLQMCWSTAQAAANAVVSHLHP